MAADCQLRLDLDHGFILGQRCLPFLGPKALTRMQQRGLVKPGKPFYLLKQAHHQVMTWSGKGRPPEWVRQFVAQGGALSDIEAIV